MPCLVFEIGFEEMPSRFLPGLMESLSGWVVQALAEAGLPHGVVDCQATPRRLALRVDDLAARQEVREELVSGPPAKVAIGPDGQPTKAGLGFAKSQGVEFAACFLQTTDKGEYLALKKTVGGASALDVLAGLCPKALAALPFPKKMRWGSMDATFGRPVRWLCCLLDDAVVPFEAFGLTSSRLTQGHRVHGPGPWEVAHAADHARVLAEQGRVTLRGEDRTAAIREQGDALVAAAVPGGGAKVVWRDRLLREVTGLVELPRALLGDFDPAFLELPKDVLLTSMETHQKSFGVENEQGELLPHFLCAINLEPTNLDRVRAGWERVLRARLSDARFFWETDLAAGFETWRTKLQTVVFFDQLGSMADKTARLEILCEALAVRLDPALVPVARRAASLAKADLVSEMVGEFAELQGVMGGVYAGKAGEPAAACQAMAEQYLPAGPDTPAPASLAGAILALADRLDTLAGCFLLGKIPSGAQDPYALRRAALGVCRICLEHGLRLPLDELLALALAGYASLALPTPTEPVQAQLLEFFRERFKQFLLTHGGGGVDTLVAEAALAAGFVDLPGCKARVDALQAFSQAPDFQQAVLTFKRAANIIKKSEAADLAAPVEPSRLEAAQEQALHAAIAAARPRAEGLWKDDAFPALLDLLRELRPAVDAFFDHVMVNVEDVALRRNRLALLRELVALLSPVADFSALQV